MCFRANEWTRRSECLDSIITIPVLWCHCRCRCIKINGWPLLRCVFADLKFDFQPKSKCYWPIRVSRAHTRFSNCELRISLCVNRLSKSVTNAPFSQHDIETLFISHLSALWIAPSVWMSLCKASVCVCVDAAGDGFPPCIVTTILIQQRIDSLLLPLYNHLFFFSNLFGVRSCLPVVISN